MPKHAHPLGTDPRGVGAHNYCQECRDRICLECDKPDHATTGGSWLGGHCFDCQWVIGERQNDAARDSIRNLLCAAWEAGAQAQAAAYGMAKDAGPNPYRTEK